MAQTETENVYERLLAELAASDSLRACRTLETAPGLAWPQCRVDGFVAVDFASNDYLGLARDERLKQAAMAATEKYGTGAGAARLVSGTHPLIAELEESLAAFKQTEKSLVFNSGYQANVGILQALLGKGDFVFGDKLNHASLVDGCQLSGAKFSRYRHLDLNHLEALLKKAPSSATRWIVTDSVFSMDGDYADLVGIVQLADRYGARIMVDEAHATGLFGDRRSSGLVEVLGLSGKIDLQMGTFSKALGGFGAYVAGSDVLMKTLMNKARSFIYSTALPPSVIAAALKAVELVQTDPSLKSRLWANVALFKASLVNTKFPACFEGDSPIIPLVLGDNQSALTAGARLLEAGYFVQAIRPPTVPANTARLRLTLSAAHSDAQISGLLAQLQQF